MDLVITNDSKIISVDFNTKDQNGDTPIKVAIKTDKIGVVKLLLQHPWVDKTDKTDVLKLMMAQDSRDRYRESSLDIIAW